MPQEFKRSPSVERKISEISNTDIRVRILGTIIGTENQSVILDDGTGKIKASFEFPIGETNPKNLVRVIGKVVHSENGIEINGEILQNMEKLDLDVFKKLSSIKILN